MKALFLSFWCLLTASAFAQSFDVYVSDAGNFNNPPWQILKFDESGENPSVFINSNLNWPQDILFLEGTNEVLISNLGSGCIHRHDAVTGAFIDAFACDINGPTRIKIGPDNFLYVLQWTGNGRVRRYDLNGSDLGEFTSVGVNQSIGLDWDTQGNLYVSSYNGKLVRKFDENGNDQGLFIDSNLLGPTNIWFDSNGDLLVSDYNGTAVKRFDSSGTYVGDFMSGLSKSEGIDFLPNGDILIGNGATSSVKRFDAQGNYIDDLIASGTGNLLTPNAVVLKEPKTTAIQTVNRADQQLIFPTIGNQFTLAQDQLEKMKVIVVYNNAGKLQKYIRQINTSSIDASQWSNGVYFFWFYFRDGSVYTERVVVHEGH